MSYLAFVDRGLSESGLTKIWLVHSVKSAAGDHLGKISWHGAWRKYVFQSINAIYDEGCLVKIANFLRDETVRHCEARKNLGGK